MWRAQVPHGRFSNSESQPENDRSQNTGRRELVKNITGDEWRKTYCQNEKVKDKSTISQFLDTYIRGQTSKKNVREKGTKRQNPFQNVTSEMEEKFDDVLPLAKMYQEYMKDILIPKERQSVIPYQSWYMLGKSIKKLYKQPLHYRTNVLLKDWDKGRINTEFEMVPMDQIMHPAKAEALIWLVEENHRVNTSNEFLAKLWVKDPMYHACVDPHIPQP